MAHVYSGSTRKHAHDATSMGLTGVWLDQWQNFGKEHAELIKMHVAEMSELLTGYSTPQEELDEGFSKLAVRERCSNLQDVQFESSTILGGGPVPAISSLSH